MYDRPNAIKGRYVKIPNMLIFVAEPVNHEVIDLWRLFNIIYIMRTSINQGRIQSLAVMIVVLINNDHPISHLLPYSRLNRPCNLNTLVSTAVTTFSGKSVGNEVFTLSSAAGIILANRRDPSV